MSAYPLMLDGDALSAMIVGGGTVATRKAVALVRTGARVHVVAPACSPEMEILASNDLVDLTRAMYSSSHIGDALLVIAATDDAETNARVASDDLTFDWHTAVRANTFDAHRLCALALAMGGPALQGAAVERFHSAHFREGLAIDDHEVLQRAAAEAGLDERRVAAVLAGDAYADEVRGDEELARSMGVTSVPFVLANGYAAISGARSIDDFLALLRGVVTQRV